MKHSLTYYLTLLVIKLKGFKKDFSKDPIDFKKIRKEDVHHPSGKFFKSDTIRSFRIANSLITEVGQENKPDGLLIFVHGGAFISGPGKHHWDTIQEISLQTNLTIWMCDYPKAPENNITVISDNMDAIYETALEQYAPENISLIGDSAGGTLVAALTQRLVLDSLALPKRIILVSPVMDSSMSNSEIDKIDAIDPMLSKIGVRSAKKMCAEDENLLDVRISPLNGSFDEFPRTVLFMAEHDVTYPDQLLTVQKLKDSNINVDVIIGEGMPHIWPFLPVMYEAKLALKAIIDELNS